MNIQTQLLRHTVLSTAIITSLTLAACSSSGGSHSSAKQDQTITFTAPTTLAIGDSQDLKATSSGNLAVTYATTTTDICTIASNKVTAKAKGDCKITASQAGDGNFNAAPDVAVTVPVVSSTIDVTAQNLSLNQAGTITLAGKLVGDGITAKLGDKDIAINKKGDYMAQIAIAAGQLTMAGDVPLVIKKGTDTIYDSVINVAPPKAIGDSDTLKKTGIDTCGNDTDNTIDCGNKTALGEYYQTGQDGEIQSGTDVSYTKVAHQITQNGKKSMEYCIYDNVTGLLWEDKTTDGGLRDKNWRYTWSDSNPATNGGLAGFSNSQDSCNGTLDNCNSENYIKKLNATNYCGHNDWRLPNKQEMMGIYDFSKTKAPFINDIFANIYINTKHPSEAYYLTSNSVPTTARNIEINFQYFVTGNFSTSDVTISSNGLKNAYGHYLMAVRGDGK